MSACIDTVEYLREYIDTSKVGNAVDTEVNEFYFDAISIPHSKRQSESLVHQIILESQVAELTGLS